MRRSFRTLSGVTLASACLVGISACGHTSDGVSDSAKQPGVNSNRGPVEMLDAGKRQKPVSLSGTLLDGKKWNVTSARGKVVVLNVWGAWCGPCQEEMPHMQKAWQHYAGKPSVVFMGIDQRDSNAVATSTLKRWNVTYPSLANDDGQNLQGLQRKVVATPTTLVLDKQGRIAGRISGTTTETTIRTMVDQLAAEKA